MPGCGQSVEHRVTGTVTGKVIWSGRPANEQILIIGVERTTGRVCQGKVEPDGSCQLEFGSSSGVPVGVYDLALARYEEPMTPERYERLMKREIPHPSPLKVPAKYLNCKKSGWYVDVTDGNCSFEVTVAAG
ncbi:MAG: hypothetical protein C0478_11305 [Planctomyces sp.]|nr:hypothetical protein [Planctomyces sp.]